MPCPKQMCEWNILFSQSVLTTLENLLAKWKSTEEKRQMQLHLINNELTEIYYEANFY